MNKYKIAIEIDGYVEKEVKANSEKEALTKIRDKADMGFYTDRYATMTFNIFETEEIITTNADREKEGQLVLTIPQKRGINE